MSGNNLSGNPVIEGGTDGTSIGNVSDSLKTNTTNFHTQGSTTAGQDGPLVQGAVSTSNPTYTNGQTNPLSLTTSGKLRTEANITVAGGTAFSWSNKLRYDDMNVSTGGVVRGTIFNNTTGWVQMYSYSGTGYLMGAQMTLQGAVDWEIRIQVDGDEIFGANGIKGNDMNTTTLYNMQTSSKSIPELDQEIGLMWGSSDRFQWHGPFLIPVRFESNVKVYLRKTSSGNRTFNAGLVTLTKET